MFVIVSWTGLADIGLVIDEEGRMMIFSDVHEAINYAKENLNGKWYPIPIN